MSHGKQSTGGYLHEKFLAENLFKALGSDHYVYEEKREWKYFIGTLSHLKLFLWAFKNGNADINICVARIALPIIIRNLFNRKKTIVVWHFYDAYDGKSNFLRKWYHLLVHVSYFIPRRKLAFVAVAPFWKNYFSQFFKLKKVFLFPNFFDPLAYLPFKDTKKKKQIHLGQVSFKNSMELFTLAEHLNKKGYRCYFSTNDPEKVYTHLNYDVLYFEHFQDYLREMAASEYTLAMPFIKEGWNRIAHESMLLGTQVIGFNQGGLGDLLKGANAFALGEESKEEILQEYYREYRNPPASNFIEETIEIIINKKQKPIYAIFLQQFEVEQIGNYLIRIKDWCKK